ncbi:hypothetical protein PPH41_33180, partial [Burkholderia gladioli]|nr:hypothetical protein [Burkholderia gladioli]
MPGDRNEDSATDDAAPTAIEADLSTLEQLVARLFEEWPALEAVTLSMHKPKIRPGTRRVGVELDWT